MGLTMYISQPSPNPGQIDRRNKRMEEKRYFFKFSCVPKTWLDMNLPQQLLVSSLILCSIIMSYGVMTITYDKEWRTRSSKYVLNWKSLYRVVRSWSCNFIGDDTGYQFTFKSVC